MADLGILLSLAMIASPALAQGGEAGAIRSWPAAAPVLDGFARRRAGDEFSYHSAHPTLAASLLVRSLDSSRFAEWETAPVPAGRRPDTVEFTWLAAMDVADAADSPVRFFVDLNGALAFELPQPGPSMPRAWSLAGPGGARLSYRVLMVDRHGDVHGLMSLRLPARAAPVGRPVRIRVRGESVGRRSWYIVYAGSVRPALWLTSEQALLADGDSARQSLRLRSWSLVDSTTVTVAVDGRRRATAVLPLGDGGVRIGLPPVRTPRRATVTVASGATRVTWRGFRVAPVVPRVIHLIPHAHLDVGYTDLQPAVLRKQWAAIDSAIALAERTASYPAGSRFRWTVEGLWPAEALLDSAPPALQRRFLDAVRNGQLSLNGFYANLMTGLSRPEELFRALDYANGLRDRYRVPITTAMTSDVPGFAWSVVPALAQQGVRYLSSGPNYQPTLPSRGDRIGPTLDRYGDRPFWWLGPSRRDSVLVLTAGRGYSWFHGFDRGRLTLDEADRVIGYLGELARDGYPYEPVQVRYTIGGDNGVPDPALPDVVREWNRRFVSPRLVISTLPELFAEFERRYGAELPRRRGDWTGFWEDGAGSTAREVALSRTAAERLVQAEALWAMRRPGAFPTSDFHAAWRDVLLMSEHTWGADRSISDPDLADVRAQWDWKRARAEAADSMSRSLLAKAVGEVAGGDGTRIRVVNTLSWSRAGLVLVPPEPRLAGDRVRTPDGRDLPTQRLSTGELAIAVPAVPAFGSLILEVGPGRGTQGSAGAVGDSIWNEHLTARIDPVTGAIRTVRWRGRELVAAGAGWADYRYVSGLDEAGARGATGARIEVVDRGPLVASLRVSASAPGARGLVRVVRLVAGSSDLEIDAVVDKELVRSQEGVHLGFPFQVADGMIRLDNGWGVVRPDRDQLPGANRNVFPIGRWADISARGFGVTLFSADAPLLEIGRLTAEEWRSGNRAERWLVSAPRSSTFYSYLMNNYWHTNFKADQEGIARFRYVVRPHGAFDPGAATRFGMERAMPLLATPANSGDPSLPVGLDLGADGVLVAAIRPIDDGSAFLVRLYNAADGPRSARLPAAAFGSDPAGRPGVRLSENLILQAHEVRTIRVER
ncbi:MAG: glycoside hydrolase family 38 C-terminal domain-containing protein [Gemmatimonadales bacterium]